MELQVIGLGLLIVALLFAHRRAPRIYSWKTHSISELGAQNYRYAWIMRCGFLSFGLLTFCSAVIGYREYSYSALQALSLGVYGLSLASTGVFSTCSFEVGSKCSSREAALHGLFANIAGFALTLAMVCAAFSEKTFSNKFIHGASVAFVFVVSLLFKLVPAKRGIWQRVLWAGSLAWIAWVSLRL